MCVCVYCNTTYISLPFFLSVFSFVKPTSDFNSNITHTHTHTHIYAFSLQRIEANKEREREREREREEKKRSESNPSFQLTESFSVGSRLASLLQVIRPIHKSLKAFKDIIGKLTKQTIK